MGRELAGDERLALAEAGRAVEQRAWDERKDVAEIGEVGGEFIRISARLSHCETTFSCTFCGRCVATSR